MLQDAYRQLAATILLQAMHDARGKSRSRIDTLSAVRFARSRWCEALCDLVHVPYAKYKETIDKEATKRLSRQKRLVLPG